MANTDLIEMLTDDEILALVDNRMDVATEDHPRCGWGLGWECPMKAEPDADRYNAVAQSVKLLTFLQQRWDQKGYTPKSKEEETEGSAEK